MRLSRLSLPAAAIMLASCSAPTTATNPAHGTVRMMRRNPIIDAERYFSEMSTGTVTFDVPKEVRIAVTSPVGLRLTPNGTNIGGNEPGEHIMVVHHHGRCA